MLPPWAHDNFFIGFLAGCVFMLIAVGMESFWGRYIQPRLRERKKKRDLERYQKGRPDPKPSKKDVEHFEEVDGRAEPTPPPSSRPRPSASAPPPDATAEIEVQPQPGLETQAMPAVRPSQFSTPPPPLPAPLPSAAPQPTEPVGSSVWSGPERRSADPQPYEGEERRGRHSDPEGGRRRRRDDPHDQYDL
jgi:hypothetical protein